LAQQAFTVNNVNVHVAAAPPSNFVPNTNGVAVPAGLTGWDLAIDLGGSIPAGQPFAVTAEYQRPAWTDAAGVQHSAGEWLQSADATMETGPHTPPDGEPSTTINHLSGNMGALNPDGTLQAPYPTRVRLRIDQSGAWTLPSVTLTLI